MKSVGRFRLLGAAPFCLFFSSAFAQQPLPAPAAANPDIHLDVVVAGKSGPPVGNLQQQDFKVLDDNTAQPILSFQAVGGSQVPAEVFLVVDEVNTAFQNVAYERGQIDKFLRANGGQLAHPTTLVIFTDTGTQIQEKATTDGNALSAMLDHQAIGLRDIRRSTGIYGADERLQLSIQALQALVSKESGVAGRKLVLWISPGWPILSGPGIILDAKQQQGIFASVVQMSTVLRQNRITLYAIDALGVLEGPGRTYYYEDYLKGVTKPGEANIGDLSLQVLARQSGGMALSSSDVNGLLQQSVADLDSYYQITFRGRPAEKADEYHPIKVEVDKPGVTARTRMGYYAQP